MARDYKIREEIRGERMFVTGSSRSVGTDTILTSSYNAMSNSFAQNRYLGPDGQNHSATVGAIIWNMDRMQGDISDIHHETYNRTFKTVQKITNLDTSPSVEGGDVFITSNLKATDITTFDDGTDGQQITIIVGDNNTDFSVGSKKNPLQLSGGKDWTTAATNDTITFVYNGTNWYEVCRSDNSK